MRARPRPPESEASVGGPSIAPAVSILSGVVPGAAGLPDRRVVIAFELRGSRGPRLHYWLICERDDVSVCPEDPGFAEDVRLVTSPTTLYLLLAGGIGVAQAMDDGLMRIEGPPSLVRAVPAWLGMGRLPDGPLPAASLVRASGREPHPGS